jgi:putative ABC transport system substrate-binding protein
MRRRDFITLLGGAAAWPVAARAQQVAAVPVIGFLEVGTRSDTDRIMPGFRQGLREAGFVEGQNLAIEYRWAENQTARLPAFAAELVQRRVAVIVAGPNRNAIAAATRATATIPIVFMSGPDPVRQGLVASLNRPGGNVTGVTLLSAELTAKRLGLLHDLVPQATVVAMLLSGRAGSGQRGGSLSNQADNLEDAETAARGAGLQIVGAWTGDDDDFDAAFATAVRERASALLVSSSIFFINNRYRLVALAAKHSLPTIYQDRDFAAAGGLMSYGPSTRDAYRQVGLYTGRILRGEKPGNLPVQLPTKFELVINLQTAKALGLTIPAGVLAIADEVIE